VRLGIAHHLGWAVAVVAGPDHMVVDRRRIELVEPGVPVAPIHHEGGAHELHRLGDPPDDDALAELVARVRASAVRATSASLDVLPGPIESISLRAWPDGFPTDIATLRRAPYESQADSVLYRLVLAEVAAVRSWEVHRYDARTVEDEAAAILGDRAHEVLHGPRSVLGPPWSKDHRTALAAAVVAGQSRSG